MDVGDASHARQLLQFHNRAHGDDLQTIRHCLQSDGEETRQPHGPPQSHHSPTAVAEYPSNDFVKCSSRAHWQASYQNGYRQRIEEPWLVQSKVSLRRTTRVSYHNVALLFATS